MRFAKIQILRFADLEEKNLNDTASKAAAHE